MPAETFVNVFVAVLAANGLTVAGVYFFWRIKKDENDHKGRLGLLGVFAIAGLVLYASTSG